MNAAILLFFVLIVYVFGYLIYGRLVAKNFKIDPSRKTPAHEQEDGVDFVPAKNWWVLFGHHFSSVCGAGPIIGPVLACAYWGWGVSTAWLVIGAIWMGAVSDFSSLLISVREGGQSVAQISGDVISKKARLYFSIFLWIALILVIAVFSIFAAKTFIQQPDAVIPSFGLIPTAVVLGWFLYQKKKPITLMTALGLAVLILLLWVGTKVPVQLPSFFGVSPQSGWILILLGYCFVASVVPVQVLLQPRDYLASFILFALIAIGIIGVFFVHPTMQGSAFLGFQSSQWPKSGPLFPMLFVTIACGAISGFHSLVSSGTTCKQLSSETHACRIGYGGMILESIVGVLVVICVGAGLSQAELSQALKNGGPIAAFSQGYGNVAKVFLGSYGSVFAVLALNTFILTTLDTAARITRYITSEVFGIQNKYLATLLVIMASGALALTGKWNLLWPVFGASNQLIAGIALLVASCWLLQKGKNFWMTLFPACLMLTITISAFCFQFFQALIRKTPAGATSPDWPILTMTVLLIVMAGSIILESMESFAKTRRIAFAIK